MKTPVEIKAIATGDAQRAYRDVRVYRIDLKLNARVWEVTFNFKGQTLDGGGPYYEIDAETGSIVKRIYYQ